MGIEELRRALREAVAERDRLLGELENLRTRESAGGDDVDGVRERMGNVNRGISRADERVREIRADLPRSAVLAERATSDDRDRNVDGAERDRRERDELERLDRGEVEPRNDTRDAALRTIERHASSLAEGAGDALEGLVRDRDAGRAARYLTTVGSRAYFDAFGVLLADPVGGHMRLTREQHEAIAARAH
jgi:hypothetical protein